jgi:hypothetical protein
MMNTGIAWGYCVAALAPNLDIAATLQPGYMMTLLCFTGLLLNFNSIPSYWMWYAWFGASVACSLSPENRLLCSATLCCVELCLSYLW